MRLASWMYAFFATHSGSHWIDLAYLAKLSGQPDVRTDSLKKKIERACAVLGYRCVFRQGERIPGSRGRLSLQVLVTTSRMEKYGQ